jgi:UDP-glucose 4-epimerase
MTIIITGSEGYIGTNLKKLLNRQGVPYIGFDRKLNYDLLSPLGQAEFEHFAGGATTVIHLAARPRIPASWSDTQQYVRDNIELTEYVARVCAEKKCHLIFASSSSVYGNGDGPLNPYAWTKQSSEDIIRIYGNNDLEYTICRLFTTYGNDGPLVLDTWLRQTKQGQAITLRGNGSQARDFIHVEDVANALYVLSIKKPYNITLDIGTGASHTLNSLANLFPGKVVQEPELEGYAHSTRADAELTKALLEWEPAHSAMSWIRSSLDKLPNLDAQK